MDYRCDRCRARAQAQFGKWGAGTLLLCQHHANIHADALEQKDWIVTAVIGAGALV
jgi:hypothetical protein